MEARYIIEMNLRFTGHAPPHSNRAAPELSRVQEIAVNAARRVIEDAGYEITGLGHGARRIDLP